MNPNMQRDTQFLGLVTSPSAIFVDGGVAASASFATVSQAINYITANSVPAPRVIYVMAGIYTESFTLPAQTALIGIGDVTINGGITLTNSASEYLLQNIKIKQAAAGIALDADMGGLGATGHVVLRNCKISTGIAGATALAAQSCRVDAHGLEIVAVVAASVGIDLLAGDSASENTSFFADSLRIEGTGFAAALRTADGAGPGDNRVDVRIGDLSLVLDGGATGILLQHSGAPASGAASGLLVESLHCVSGAPGAACTFYSGAAGYAGESKISNADGSGIVADVIFANVAGDLVVGFASFSQDAGVLRTSFQLLALTAGNVVINGALVQGGTSSVVAMLAGAGNLTLRNCTGTGLEASGRWFSQVDAVGVVRIENSTFKANGGVVAMVVDGGNAGSVTLRDVLLVVAGAASGVTVLDASFTLEGAVQVQHNTSGEHALEILNPTGAAVTTFSWQGAGNVLQVPAGTGFGLKVASALTGAITLQEEGLLGFGSTALDDQFEINAAGGGALNMIPSIGLATVVSGSLASHLSAIDLVGAGGVGAPSPYPGLHFATQIVVTQTGNGVASAFNATLTNVTTGVNAAAPIADVLAVRASEVAPLAAAVPVGPGQLLQLNLDATANVITDLVVEAA